MASKNKQKLELTWIGKDRHLRLEPRILLEDSEKSYHAPHRVSAKDCFDNLLIHGDNLLALKALEAKYAGKVKCIFIDPPYNTGNAFEHYEDGLEHSLWLTMMRDRLDLLRNLLCENGVIFVQIDDTEYAYLKVLMDEVFGRPNFVNTISINMKKVAGASGGGEDRKLKKNIEYALLYSKDYSKLEPFESVYDYIPIGELVENYRKEGKSWKYTSALTDAGSKTYLASTVDGDGNEIKIFQREGTEIQSINQIMSNEGISESDAYAKYSSKIFSTAMPQSSIRPRVMTKVKEVGSTCDIHSIEYIPKTGRNKGKIYEQFYKGDKFRLFAWLRDVSEEVDGKIYKKELQGTYWDFASEMNNLTKEGGVLFPNGKKPEKLLERILTLSTKEGDLVLDSFAGSGTTGAVAHKMNRRWIMVELGEHCYTHILPRLKKLINGEDQGGISKTVDWQGGGGFRYYTLAPSLLKKDKWNRYVINKAFNPEMLAEALCKQAGFTYQPNPDIWWQHGHSSEHDFIYATTQTLTHTQFVKLSEEVGEGRSLFIYCGGFRARLDLFPNLTVRKIPPAILENCEWDKDDYSFEIDNLSYATDTQAEMELDDA